MSAGLLLLLVFIGAWLHSEYNREHENLTKELRLTATEVSSGIQDSIMQKIISEQLKVELKKNGSLNIRYREGPGPEDTVGALQFTFGKGFLTDTAFVKLDTAFISIIDSTFPKGPEGPPYHSAMFTDKEPQIPFATWADIGVKITTDVDDALASSELPSNYVVKERADSVPNEAILITLFTDLQNEKSYIAVFDDYQPYLLGKIGPQILFSFVLFLIIALSFASMYRGLKKQEKLNLLKNNFVDNMTHELKTPISTVSVALEAISDFGADKDPVRTKEYLDISRMELRRLSLLVDRVLKMSRMEGRPDGFSFKTVDLHEILMKINSTFGLQLQKSQSKLEITLEGGEFPVYGDKIHLTNVLYNLVDNSLKHNREGVNIKVRMAIEDKQVVIELRDDGRGIPREYKDKVFERFFRLPTGDVHNTKGHGLGLSYVKEVIDHHNGNIEIDSAEGQGVHITIKLPLNAV